MLSLPPPLSLPPHPPKAPFFQSMHDIRDLRRSQPHFLKLLKMGKHCLWRIIKGHLAAVHHNEALHIFCYIFHTVGNQKNGNAALLVKKRDLIQNLVPSFGSSPAVGSSRIRILGFMASTPAIATRFSVPGKLKRRFSIVFFFKTNLTERFFRLHFCFLSGKSLIHGVKHTSDKTSFSKS